MKENDIVVRHKTDFQAHKVGSIDKIINITSSYYFAKFDYGCSKDEYRLATQLEIDAYNKGIKNIKDISELKISDKDMFVIGQYYKISIRSNPALYTIAKCEGFAGKDNFSKTPYISNMNGEGFKYAISTPAFNDRYYKIATKSEVDWLKVCIKLNKFIPFDEVYKIEEEYIFPEKWCIRQDADKECNKYWNENIKNTSSIAHLTGAFTYICSDGKMNNNLEEFTEITPTQFKQYILNYNPVQESINQSKVADEQWNQKQRESQSIKSHSNNHINIKVNHGNIKSKKCKVFRSSIKILRRTVRGTQAVIE